MGISLGSLADYNLDNVVGERRLRSETRRELAPRALAVTCSQVNDCADSSPRGANWKGGRSVGSSSLLQNEFVAAGNTQPIDFAFVFDANLAFPGENLAGTHGARRSIRRRSIRFRFGF